MSVARPPRTRRRSGGCFAVAPPNDHPCRIPPVDNPARWSGQPARYRSRCVWPVRRPVVSQARPRATSASTTLPTCHHSPHDLGGKARGRAVRPLWNCSASQPNVSAWWTPCCWLVTGCPTAAGDTSWTNLARGTRSSWASEERRRISRSGLCCGGGVAHRGEVGFRLSHLVLVSNAPEWLFGPSRGFCRSTRDRACPPRTRRNRSLSPRPHP
jgi:hypothetical protein